MSKHLTSKWSSMAESTRRAVRTGLQGLAAFAAFVVAVAIPPVGDALNAVLSLINAGPVDPGLVATIGAVGIALASLAAKAQNLLENRDAARTPAQWAAEVKVMAAMADDLVSALARARSEGSREFRDLRAAMITARNALPEGSAERAALAEALMRAGL